MQPAADSTNQLPLLIHGGGTAKKRQVEGARIKNILGAKVDPVGERRHVEDTTEHAQTTLGNVQNLNV